MATITALEFGANTCAVARASVRRGTVLVSAMEVLDPAAFPGSDAFSKGLRQAKKALKLPRRARVVVWGLPDGATRTDPAVGPMVAPLVNAGFRVERVVTPCNALAALARLRTPRFNAATCWLAINRDGVAIVVIRPGKLLYSNSFLWDSSFGATGSQARLLQRYSLVSVLAPEVKRAMTAARAEGTPVEGIVTCGNLPDLRSLTMPLIEELDVEVETLDSLEGLSVKPGVAGQLGDNAAAIRIACAAALARGTRPWRATRSLPIRKVAATAAAIVATIALGWFAYARYAGTGTGGRGAATAGRGTAKAGIGKAATGPGRPVATSATTKPTVTKNVPPARTSPKTEIKNPPSVARSTAPVARSAQPVPKSPEPVAKNPQPGSQNGLTPHPPTQRAATNTPERPVPRSASPAPRPASPVPALSPAPKAAPSTSLKSAAAHADQARQTARTTRLRSPLKDPVPRVTGILVSDERRFATIDGGRIVTVGDVIGRRTVVAIEERAIVLREPSGVQIRVGLGGRLEDVLRTPR